jgi:hypothetical protein
MNVGDRVVLIDAVGTIVGVSSSGFPVVEFSVLGGTNYDEYDPSELLPVELPVPNEELDPTKDKE